MPVLLNQFNDDTWEHPELICSICQEPATVWESPGKEIRVCKYCLSTAGVEINRALLDRRGMAPPYVKLPTQKMPVKEGGKE